MNQIEQNEHEYYSLYQINENCCYCEDQHDYKALINRRKYRKKLYLSDEDILEFNDNIDDINNVIFTLSETKFDMIPFNIDKLESIRALDLDECDISYIPSSVCNLKNITHLTLSGNELYELPKEFGNLSNLEFLELNSNNIQELPKSFTKLKKLNKLQMSRNMLSDLPNHFGELKSLSHLVLSENILKRLPESFGNLHNLKSFHADFNDITYLPYTIGNLKNLNDLVLKYNMLKSLPNSICNIENLDLLELSNNNIKELPKNIGKLDNLKYLYIDNNELEYLPSSFEELIELTHLGISGNRFDDFPEELPLYLENLIMHSNNISCLDVNWEYYDDLICLDISFNSIDESNINDTFSSLQHLKSLLLSHNKFKSIPKQMSKLKKLRQFDMRNNYIDIIPDDLKNLEHLEKILLDDNNIRIVPNKLAECKYLKKISLKYNPINQFSEKLSTIINLNIDLSLEEENAYIDKESVHNSYIQNCIKNSVSNLIKDDNKLSLANTVNQIKHDNVLSEEVKKLLIEYTTDKNIFVVNKDISLLYKDLLKFVWQRIQKHKDSTEIKKILIQEIIEGKGKCFSGKLAQLVNCLVGFYDDIQINVSQNEQINLIVLNIRNKLSDDLDDIDIDKWKELTKKELLERGYSENIINIYTKAIDELI